MLLSVIIAIILAGLLLLVLEILVIPGTGVVGIIGFILIAIGIYYGYRDHEALTGNIILASTFVLSIASVWLSLRSKTWNKAMLHTQLEGKAPSLITENLTIGDKGVAISRLAPAGTALIGDVKCEVHTLGDFIDQGSEIVVIKVDQNKIYVKPFKQ